MRLTGLGLLATLGGRAAPSFTRLLASDDFILRKRVLREIREIHDPAFISGPRAARRARAAARRPLPDPPRPRRAAATGDRAEEGERLLLGVPSDQPDTRSPGSSWPSGPKRGEPERARALVGEARAARSRSCSSIVRCWSGSVCRWSPPHADPGARADATRRGLTTTTHPEREHAKEREAARTLTFLLRCSCLENRCFQARFSALSRDHTSPQRRIRADLDLSSRTRTRRGRGGIFHG